MKHVHKAVYGKRSGGGSSGQMVAPNANNSFNGNVKHPMPRKKAYGNTKVC